MELCFTQEQMLFFFLQGIHIHGFFFFFWKQLLCKPREDYTLLCLEPSQELLALIEIWSRQPPGSPLNTSEPKCSTLDTSPQI